MTRLFAGSAGNIFFSADWNDNLSFVLNNMLRLGIETGSTTNQVNAGFDWFNADTIGSKSGFSYDATGDAYYTTIGEMSCTLDTAVNAQASSITTTIVYWDTQNVATGITTLQKASFDNGTTFTDLTDKSIGSIYPSTGSIIMRLQFDRTTGSEVGSVTAMGYYYG